ncbi:MAG: hypothetical protein ACQKBY_04550 [Verrucomicrobiales bacterium]
MLKFLLLGLLFVSSSLAQGPKITLRTLALSGADFPELWLKNGEELTPLTEFSTMRASAPLTVTRANPLPVYQKITPEGEAAEPIAVKLPSSATSYLLLSWLDQDQARFAAIPDPYQSATRNDWLVINTCAFPVALQIGSGKQPSIVQPGQSGTLRVTASSGTGTAVTMARRKGEKWQRIYSNYWHVYPNSRGLVIVTPKGEKARVKVLTDPVGEGS